MGLLKRSLCFAVAAAMWCSAAAAVTVNDDYVGGDPTLAGDYGSDVIGAFSAYDISHMTVDLTNGVLSIGVFSQYFDHVGRSGTQMGDLFISTNGWTPFGAAPYPDDTFLNGTSWEIALVLSDHGSSAANALTEESFVGDSGVLSAFSVNPAQVLMSYLTTSTGFRADQAVQYLPGQQDSLAQGTWSILPGANGYAELLMTINLGQAFSSLDQDWAAHWTMTCANDVIEGGGAADVPEAGTLALLGSGLLGLLIRRKRSS